MSPYVEFWTAFPVKMLTEEVEAYARRASEHVTLRVLDLDCQHEFIYLSIILLLSLLKQIN